MDAAEIRRLKSKLRKYLRDYRDCFGRSDTRGHLNTYVEGQLSKLDRKSVEPIALAAGVPPRTLAAVSQFSGMGPRAVDRHLAMACGTGSHE